MAMNPMQRKTRNAFLLGFIAALIVGGLAVAFLITKVKSKNQEIEEVRQQLTFIPKTVFVVSKDATKGEAVTAETKSIHPNAVPKGALTSLENFEAKDETGENGDPIYYMKAKIDLTEGTVLTEDMIEKDPDASTYRLLEYTMISLPSMLQDDDYIDIRLSFQDGVNFVVLSKVKVEKSTVSTIWLKLSETDMLRLDEAVIESYIVKGSRLYATLYSDETQSEVNITYVPSENVRAIIDKNATETEKNQMQDEYSRDHRSYIDELLSQYTTDEKVDAVTEGFQSQKSLIQANRAELLGEMGY